MDIAKLLVTELQADVRVKDRIGFTPLHAAAKNGHANIVSFLLTQPGIDPVSDKVSKCQENKLMIRSIRSSDCSKSGNEAFIAERCLAYMCT